MKLIKITLSGKNLVFSYYGELEEPMNKKNSIAEAFLRCIIPFKYYDAIWHHWAEKG